VEGSRQSQETLVRVLHILERMEARLDQHDERFRSLEDTNKQVNGLRPGEISVDGNGTAFDIPRPSCSSGSPNSELEACKTLQSISKVPYSEWSTKRTLPEQGFDTNLFKAIEHKVGDCLNIPDDYRLPLKSPNPTFSRRTVHGWRGIRLVTYIMQNSHSKDNLIPFVASTKS